MLVKITYIKVKTPSKQLFLKKEQKILNVSIMSVPTLLKLNIQNFITGFIIYMYIICELMIVFRLYSELVAIAPSVMYLQVKCFSNGWDWNVVTVCNVIDI